MARSLTARRCETSRRASSETEVIDITEEGKPTQEDNCGVVIVLVRSGGRGVVGFFLKRFPSLNPFCLRSKSMRIKEKKISPFVSK